MKISKIVARLLGESFAPVDPEEEDRGPIPRSRLNFGNKPVPPRKMDVSHEDSAETETDVPIRQSGPSKPVQRVTGTHDVPVAPGGDPLAGMTELTDDDLGAFMKAVDVLPDGATKNSLKKQALSMMQQMEALRSGLTLKSSGAIKAVLGEMQGVGIPDWISHDESKSMQDALAQIRDRFVQERMDGFAHPKTHVQIEPMSREEAEARWAKVESKWRAPVMRDESKSR